MGIANEMLQQIVSVTTWLDYKLGLPKGKGICSKIEIEMEVDGRHNSGDRAYRQNDVQG